MKTDFKTLSLALAGAALVTLVGCGGSPGSGTAEGVDVTVVDGPIKNAVVCLDKNLNGACDASEPQGRTNSAGKLRLAVPSADAAKYPVLAVVGTDAEDPDGPIVAPFTMTSPPGKPALVNPLTTLVNQAMQTGATLAEAEASVQEMTNIRVSLFEDFTGKAAPTDGSANPANVARMVAVATQAQVQAAASDVGKTNSMDNSTISQADLNKVVAQKLLEMLPAIVAIVQDPANTSKAAVEQALKQALDTGSLKDQILKPEAVQLAVAVNNQNTATAAAPIPAYVPTAGASMTNLGFIDKNNWAARILTSSLAQATPDSGNMTRYVDQRFRSVNGQVAKWSFGNNPADNGILHFNGSAWVACAPNSENKSSLRDAQGNNTYNYCDNFATGKGNRATFALDGKKMIDVYNQIVAAGYTNVNIANAATALGTATFPAGSNLFYQKNQDLTKAFAYSPGSGSLVFNYSAAVATGGDGRTQPANTGCNLSEFQFGPAIATTTLEGLVASYSGQPCLFNQGSLTSGPTTYYEGGAQNAAYVSKVYSNNTIGIGSIGSVALNSTPTAFYTGNKLIRLGFQGGGNTVTYYSCDQRFGLGSVRNCSVVGNGTYSITTLADGSRVMSFTNEPAAAASFTTTRVFVERNGRVYSGFRDKAPVTNQARFGLTAIKALMTQLLGAPAQLDPEKPDGLTATSYAGTWDVREPAAAFAFNVGTRFVLNNDGTVSCFDNANAANLMTCTLNITDPATGAFTGTTSGGASLTGTLNFLAGTVSGTFANPSQSIPPGTPFVGQRR